MQQKLADLRAQFDENMAKKEQLARDVDMCSKKLNRYRHTDTQSDTLCQHRLYMHVNGLATPYKIFRHPPYGHVIKLRVWRARVYYLATATAVFSLPKLTNQ